MIIHLHFHRRTTGVSRSIENLMPCLRKHTDAAVLGYGINTQKIKLLPFLKKIAAGKIKIIHTHRVNEIIFALALRLFGAKFKLFFTRHSENKPARFTRFLMKKADVLVSLSQEMSKKLPSGNVIIPHGVNTDIFDISAKKNLNGIPQEKLITVIGRIRPAKGQLVAMKASAPVLKNNPDWGIVFVGKCDDNKYAEKILSVAETYGIARSVHLIPETKDIKSFYDASDIIVIASTSEGFSLVCLEAMACGKITVATEKTGIHSQVIKHGENGFLFPVNDTKQLEILLSDLVSGKVTPDTEKIRNTVVQDWSIGKAASELYKLYENSLQE